MATKVGALIKQARTGAGLTQEQLAPKIDGLSAADISKAERGEKDLSQAKLKEIAKITGVTQSSLLNAAKEEAGQSEGKSSAAKKPASTAGKKPAASSTAKKPASSGAGKKTSSEGVTLTAAEKKLLELYRAADKETREAAVSLLKGEQPDLLGTLVSGAMNLLGNLNKK